VATIISQRLLSTGGTVPLGRSSATLFGHRHWQQSLASIWYSV